ncbi:hypothetical protein DFH08DRAFT_645570, partial [Mycena albidolilacea]
DASTLPAAQGAYGGKTEQLDETRGKKKCWTVMKLITLGLQLIKWDGRTAHPLVDRAGRIFAILARQPDDDDSYTVSVSEAYAYIKACGATTYFPPEMRCHRRGLFAAINVGLSLGKGATVPSWLDNKKHTPLVSQLLGNSHITRMANFASSVFATWVPRLHRHYVDNNASLRTRFPDLRQPFPQSVFASTAFNFG